MRKYSFLAVFLLLFTVGCSEQITSTNETEEYDTSAIEAAESAAVGEVSEAEVAAMYPSDLETEILAPVAVSGERISKDGSIFVQVIHNSPSWLAYYVDVYVNGEKVLNNFRFRTATPYLELPADTDLEIAIAPFWSRSARRSLFTQTYNLAEGDYVLVAGGVIRSWKGARNPDGRDIKFDLFPTDGLMAASDPGNVALKVFHGSTDAPTVDVVANGALTLIDDLAFGEFQPGFGAGYAEVPAADYTLDVTTADQAVTAASFIAPLSGLGGGAAVVGASGYLTPPGFGFALIAVLPDGTVIRLPKS